MVLGGGFVDFQQFCFKCCVPLSVLFVLFCLLNSWRSRTALLITTASHNARMMLVLHNFKVIRPTVAGDFFLQTVVKSVSLKVGILFHLITRDKCSVTESVASLKNSSLLSNMKICCRQSQQTFWVFQLQEEISLF